MKYLDERIELWVYGFTITEARTYTYEVLADNTTIYYGNIFLTPSDSGKWFDITDIVKNYAYINPYFTVDGENHDLKKNFKVKVYYNLDNPNQYKESVAETVYMTYRYPRKLKRLEMDTSAEYYNNLQSGLIPVFPNKNTFELVLPFLFSSNDSSVANKLAYISYKKGDFSKTKTIHPLSALNEQYFQMSDFTEEESDNIQTDRMVSGEVVSAFGPYEGEVWWDGSTFQYWRVERINFKVGYVDEDGNWVELREVTPSYDSTGYYSVATEDMPRIKNIQFRLPSPWGDTVINLEDIHLKGNCIIYFTTFCDSPEDNQFSVTDIRYWTVAPAEEGITLKVIDSNYPSAPKVLKLTNLCDNEKGYYLMWQDRMGGIQSQHFDGISKYSEKFENTTIIDYKDNKRKIGVEVSPKFEINSGWINEEFYPNYESIFVSPYLKLYDVKEDALYEVVLTDTQYEEKTFYNQERRLFNIKLNLEKSNKQNIIY